MERLLDPKSLVFHDVISYGNITPDNLLYLIDRLSNINAIDKQGSTLLDAAVFWDRKDLCKVLLENGADVESLDTCDSPIRAAASGGNFEICKLLIEYGANLNPSPGILSQPIDAIFQFRRIGDDLSKIHSDICRLFIDKGVDLRGVIYGSRHHGSIIDYITNNRLITEPAKSIMKQHIREAYRISTR
jgi:ankyrin repeat protein